MHAYVDGNFWPSANGSFRRKRLLVSNEHISWRGKSMDLYRVSGLMYFVMPVNAAGVLTGHLYNINLYSDKERLPISLYGPAKKDIQTPAAFQRTVAVLRTHVEPRLLREALARIDRGEQVKVGSLTFSREGLHVKGFLHSKYVSWSSTLEILPPSLGTAVGSTQYIHVEDPRNRQSKIGENPSTTRNAVLVPALIDICSRRYSTG